MTPEDREIELAKLEHEQLKQEFSDRLRIQEGLGTAGLKSLIIVNGGALIALFTFIGNVGAAGAIVDVNHVWRGFAFFVAALAAAIAAQVTAYFMQSKYGIATTYELWNAQSRIVGKPATYDHRAPHAAGNAFMILTAVLVVASFMLFCAGAGFSLSGVSGG